MDPIVRPRYERYDPAPSKRHWADSPTKILGLVAAILSVVTGFFALLAQLGAFGDFRLPFLPGKGTTGDTTISLSSGQGPSGIAAATVGGMAVLVAMALVRAARSDHPQRR